MSFAANPMDTIYSAHRALVRTTPGVKLAVALLVSSGNSSERGDLGGGGGQFDR